MIQCVNHRTWQYFGGLMASIFRLRYKMLVDAQYWDVPRFQGMEYDQFDTPAATYLVWTDDKGEVRGTVRATPTDRPYMLKELWPDMVTTQDLPASLSVWEATRYCIDDSLPRELRTRIKCELTLAFLEFGLKNDIKEMIGVMPKKLWESCFIKLGWDIKFLGDAKDVGTDVIFAGLMPINLSVLGSVRKITGITAPILMTEPDAGNVETAARQAMRAA